MKKEMTKKEQIFNRIAISAAPISRAELSKSLGIALKTVGEAIRNLEKEGKVKAIDEGDGVPRYVENRHQEEAKVPTEPDEQQWLAGYTKGYADGEREAKETVTLAAERRAYAEGRKSAFREVLKAIGIGLEEVV